MANVKDIEGIGPVLGGKLEQAGLLCLLIFLNLFKAPDPGKPAT